MKAIKLISCLGLFVLLHASCARDDSPKSQPAEKPNQARVTIALEVNENTSAVSRTPERPDAGIAVADTARGVVTQYTIGDFGQSPDSAATRSTVAADMQESAIYDLWALQFDENGKLVGRPIYQSGLRGKTEVTLMLTQTPAGKQHTVHFVANTHAQGLFTENNVPTMTHYRRLVHTYTNEAEVAAENVLMMTGQYAGTLTDDQTISQPIAMTRAVAKITFAYRTANFDDGTIRVLAVQLKNVAHHTAYPEPVTAPYPAIGSHADYLPETAPNDAAGTYVWYLPENVRGTNPAITWEGNKSKKNAPEGQGDYATLVEVRAEVTTTDGATRNIGYLFYIGQDITDYSVKRNRHYRLSIDFRGIDEADQRVVAGSSTPWIAPTVSIGDVSGRTATVRATITSDGGSSLTERGFYVSKNKNEIGDPRAYLGAGLYAVSGIPSYFTRAAFVPEVMEQVLTGLEYNTTYYVRPYATNLYGTTVGEQGTFTTNGSPTILTVQVKEVKATTATVEYKITDNGNSTITDKGLVYSKQKDFVPTATAGVTRVSSASLTELKLGTGTAGSSNPPLQVNTTYYVRAYATNAAGTSYGKQLMLTTPNPPTFASTKVTAVQDMYVQANVGVTGAVAATQMGAVWSTADFANPATGTLVEGSKNGSSYTLKLGSGYPAAWYLYPAARTEAGGEWYYGTKYSSAGMPGSPMPDIPAANVIDKENKVTVGVGALTPGSGSSITTRGILWSTTGAFDPLTSGATDVAGAPNASGAYQLVLQDVLPNQYYVRSYATNTAGHTYYSAPGSFNIPPLFENRVSFGTGETISGNVPSTHTLVFGTNTNWTLTGTHGTLNETSGTSTKWADKSITLNIARNETEVDRTVSAELKTTVNGTSAPLIFKWTMKQPAADVYAEPLDAGYWDYPLYVATVNAYVVEDDGTKQDWITWDEAHDYCKKWGGRLPAPDEIIMLLREYTNLPTPNYGYGYFCIAYRDAPDDFQNHVYYSRVHGDPRTISRDTQSEARCVRETLEK